MKYKYETIIGLEVHLQLATKQKAFCTCLNEFGAAANSLTCPYCLGQEGAMPQLNRQAVDYALLAAVALNCAVAEQVCFDRKHYIADDMPKGYQITQQRFPIGRQGYLDVEVDGQVERIQLKQIHLEEDAARAVQGLDGESIDFNRSGIPLLEIVTPPVFRSAKVVRSYLQALQLLVRYLGISDARIEAGSLRCELNISLRPGGGEQLGELCEVKNIGSFSGVVAAIAYEQERQATLLESGRAVARETRRWDEEAGATLPMREKEQAADYHFAPEPRIAPIVIDAGWLANIRQRLPELPLAKQLRYQAELGLSPTIARELTADPALAAYFEAVLAVYPMAVEAANWLLADLRALLNQVGASFAQCPLAASELAQLLELVRSGVLSHHLAKELLREGFLSGQAPAALAQERGLEQVSDGDQLKAWVAQVMNEQVDAVAQYRSGQTRVFTFLMGQVMRLSGGRANPTLVTQKLEAALAKTENG